MSSLLIDLNGKELEQEEVELLSHPLVAGLILFTRNFENREQIQELIRSVRQRVKKPLLITVDQEGGRVQRFRDGFTMLPSMQAFQETLSATEQVSFAKEAGWQMAAEMIALDIDLSFAPVLDLGHECRAIGDRSFSSDIKSAVNLATAFIDGMHQAGMASTGKHFPGHGHILADSHLETPYDDRTKDEIFSSDLQPFQQLISQNKLDAIMPAHVIYSQCDSQPASGSKYWLKEILRKKLNFQGTIFSDDLGMKGAGVMGNFVERSKKALNAGCDLLLLCNEREGVIQVLDNLKLAENEPHFMARQARLQSLFKRREINWNDLISDQRWRLNYQKLADIQHRWLDIQAAKND